MRLYEYQSKSLFAKYGIPVPQGRIASIPQEAGNIARELGCPVVVKAQSLTGNRNQRDGIQIAQTPEMAEEHAAIMLGRPINGQIVHSVLVEAAAAIASELYMSIVSDPEINKPMMIIAEAGGEIARIVKDRSDSFIREPINPFLGFLEYQAHDLASSINLPYEHWDAFAKIAHNLFTCYAVNDATLAEINPLVITSDNEFLALGGKIIIDDNALYRQPIFANMRESQSESTLKTPEAEINYIKLDGQIACIVNGAGLALSIIDMISSYGGESIRPANLIDIGEDAQTHKVEAALRLILADDDVKVALINIFGGMTGCDQVALSILQIMQELQTPFPMVIRLTGGGADEGRAIIDSTQLPYLYHVRTLTEAVKKAVAEAGKEAYGYPSG